MKLQKGLALAIAVCSFIGGFSNLAGAQTPAVSFGELGGSLKPGRTISVLDDAGRTVTGKLRDLSATSLRVRVDGHEETLPQSRIREITEHRRMTRSFAKIGFLAGAVAGVALGVTAEDCFGCPGPGATAVAGAIFLGGIGTGIGAIVGSQKSRDRLVYQASAHQPRAFSVTPVWSAHGTGLRAVFRF
jgi:hypothetical protein